MLPDACWSWRTCDVDVCVTLTSCDVDVGGVDERAAFLYTAFPVQLTVVNCNCQRDYFSEMVSRQCNVVTIPNSCACPVRLTVVSITVSETMC